jgi:hypothetical protein
MGARVFVGVEGLELDFFSLWLCLASWLCDVDHPDVLLVKLGHLTPIDERVGRDKAVTMLMRRSPKLKALKLSGMVTLKVDIFTLEHDKLVSQKRKNLTKVLNKSKRDS